MCFRWQLNSIDIDIIISAKKRDFEYAKTRLSSYLKVMKKLWVILDII